MSDDELDLSLGPSPVVLNEFKVSFSISAKKNIVTWGFGRDALNLLTYL